MKLLKYVMTSDSGLAPNPFFGVCSLALCTPNHQRARLEPGDWVVAHSSKDTGWRLVYAMQLTRVLDMPTYFDAFPQKRPNPNGSYEQMCGDNLYYRDGARWMRLPSAEHNTEKCFRDDVNRPVFLAEGADNFWYFGASNDRPELAGFSDRFPWLIRDTHGVCYERDLQRIASFVEWLRSLGGSGLLGRPRDQVVSVANCYIITTDPQPHWINNPSVGLPIKHAVGKRESLPPRMSRRDAGCVRQWRSSKPSE